MDTVIKIGVEPPPFELVDIKGNNFSSKETKGNIVVLNFWSAECTWSKRVDHELIGLLDAWKDQVKVVWIASNTNESSQLIEKTAKERKIPTVLLDVGHKVADLYGAEMTPHFYIIDANGKLAYQGAWDDITFRQRVATRLYVQDAVEALRKGLAPAVTQTPAYGCVLVRYTE